MKYRFASFELDADRYLLLRSGSEVHVEPRVFDLLAYLVEHRDRVVSKDELVERVWEGAFVSDSALKKALQSARTALGDSGTEQRLIQTVHRRGCRFVGEVETAEPAADPPAGARETAPGTVAQPGPASRRRAVRSIAVLPFLNLGGGPEDAHFADGMTEEIINALCQLGELRVAARTSSFFFKDRPADVAEVGARLNVASVLEGSVRRAGDRLRITAQLVDVADGYHLWSQRYDRHLDDVFQVQDEIATAIAAKLEVTLCRDASGPLVKRATQSLAAYEAYLKGRTLFEQRGPGLLHAVEHFEQALALDDDFALAHAGLANALGAVNFWSLRPPGETMPRAVAAAERALELDDGSAQAHTARGWVAFIYEWDWERSAREFRRAIELQPSSMIAHYWYGMYWFGIELDLERSVAECRRAVELDPLSSQARALLALAYLVHQRYSEGIEIMRDVADRDPSFFNGHRFLGLGLLLDGSYEEALSAYERACDYSGRHPWAVSELGITHAATGNTEQAETLLEELVKRSRESYVQPFVLAQTCAALGREDEALALLVQGYEERDAILSLLRCWPLLDPLRDHPRFRSLMRRLDLPNHE